MEEQTLSMSHNPWAALTGETLPTISFEKRGRGRPRKHNIPQITGKIAHKMSDHENKASRLTLNERRMLIDQFKELIDENGSIRESLTTVSARFEITYQKAFDELSEFF